MEKKKIIMIAVIVVIIIAVVFGLVYQFALKDKTPPAEESTVYDESKIDDGTKEILENELGVEIGRFVSQSDIQHGGWVTLLDVNVTNKTDIKKSFKVEIAAVEKETNKILRTEILEVNDLEPAIAETINIFEDIKTESRQEMLTAEYKVLKVTAE